MVCFYHASDIRGAEMTAKRAVPKILWIALISLGLFACFHLYLGFSRPLQFFNVALNLILMAGLYRSCKWAYVLAIVASLAGPALVLPYGPAMTYTVLVLNSSVVIPVILSTSYFFRRA